MSGAIKPEPHSVEPPAPHGSRTPTSAGIERSVVRQLFWAVFPFVLVVQLSASALLQIRNVLAMERQLEERLSRITETRAILLAEPLWKMRYDKIANVLSELIREDAVTSARVIDDTGAIVAEAQGKSPELTTSRLEQPLSYVNGNISVGAGRLLVSYTTEPIYAEFWKDVQTTVLVAFVAALAMVIALRGAADIYIGGPLSVMIGAIGRSKVDGRSHPVVVKERNEFSELAAAFNALQDATAAAKERLQQQATQDALTGLPNRRLLGEQLRRAATGKVAKTHSVALHFIDLDDFKAINDTFGHEGGDHYLMHIAEQLRQFIGPEDWVARIGGDEFIVLQTDADGEAGARQYARQLLKALATPVELRGKSIVPRASVGIAVRRNDDPELSNLPALADIALYHAKACTPGSVSLLNDELVRQHARRRELELALPIAFEQKQFEVWFQCQIDNATGLVAGLEALVRWRHPQYGLIPPSEFVSLAEQSGASAQLARMVFEQICVARKELEFAGYHDLRIAMNVSPHELTDFSFLEDMERLSRSHDVSLASFEIEITEGSLINNVAHTLEVLERIRATGVTVALDDFGKGYSSLSYLRRFPLDKMKIDKAFVRDVPSNPDDLAILEIIVTLAKKLQLTVVAEGVEKSEQAAALRLLGIEISQGFLFHRPQPLPQALLAVHSRNGAGRPMLRAVG